MDSIWLFGSPSFILLARLFLASLFLMAGSGKLLDWKGSTLAVERYRILPTALARGYGACLPVVDVAIAALLYVGVSVYGAGLAGLTLLSFIIAAGIVIRRGTNLECGCFGLLYRERIGWVTVARDAVLLVLALDVLLFDSGRFALANIARAAAHPANGLALLLTLVSLAATLGAIALGYRHRGRPPVVLVLETKQAIER